MWGGTQPSITQAVVQNNVEVAVQRNDASARIPSRTEAKPELMILTDCSTRGGLPRGVGIRCGPRARSSRGVKVMSPCSWRLEGHRATQLHDNDQDAKKTKRRVGWGLTRVLNRFRCHITWSNGCESGRGMHATWCGVGQRGEMGAAHRMGRCCGGWCSGGMRRSVGHGRAGSHTQKQASTRVPTAGPDPALTRRCLDGFTLSGPTVRWFGPRPGAAWTASR